jgi:hypothetical protein
VSHLFPFRGRYDVVLIVLSVFVTEEGFSLRMEGELWVHANEAQKCVLWKLKWQTSIGKEVKYHG